MYAVIAMVLIRVKNHTYMCTAIEEGFLHGCSRPKLKRMTSLAGDLTIGVSLTLRGNHSLWALCSKVRVDANDTTYSNQKSYQVGISPQSKNSACLP